jgi:hypothetical protein
MNTWRSSGGAKSIRSGTMQFCSKTFAPIPVQFGRLGMKTVPSPHAVWRKLRENKVQQKTENPKEFIVVMRVVSTRPKNRFEAQKKFAILASTSDFNFSYLQTPPLNGITSL